MKILYITSLSSPNKCGIGDYTYNLAKNLNNENNFKILILAKGETSDLVFGIETWNLFFIFKTIERINKYSPDIIHVQYPGKGLGFIFFLYFLIIFLKFKKNNLFLTLHEYEISSIFRKISSFILFLFVPNIIFTNIREKFIFLSYLPKIFYKNKKIEVINIAPNIFNRTNKIKSIPSKIKKIATFGLFYPGRKMEEVLNFFQKINLKDLKFYIIGAYYKNSKKYFEYIKEKAYVNLGKDRVEFIINKENIFLENFFHEIDIFILLYSDGASFKRTSLMTAMSFGVPVVSNKGKSTPEILKDGFNIILTETDTDLYKKIIELIKDKELYSTISANSYKTYLSFFSWDFCIKSHIRFYDKILNWRM